MMAMSVRAAMTGTCKNTASADTQKASDPDVTATAMLPARDHAALRPRRLVNVSLVNKPTVRAAIAGSNTPLTTCIIAFAMRTGQKVDDATITTAPTARINTDAARRPRLR